MDRYFIAIFIFLLLFIGCNYKTNDEIINLIKNKVLKHQTYDKMVNIIFKLNLNDKDCTIRSSAKDFSISIYFNNEKFSSYYSKNKENEFGLMMFNNKCYIQVSKNKSIEFIYRFKNKNGDSYRLIYSILDKVNYQELYPDFEIIKGDERPTKNGGWIYIINPQWIIYSPHKTNKNNNDRLTEYFQLYLLAIAIVFIIMKVLKKRKQ